MPLATRILLFTLLLVSKMVNGQGGTFVFSPEDLTENKVNALLEEAVANPDSAKINYERAVFISERIEYDAGAMKAYTGLVDYYRSTNDIGAELRQLLFQIKYFEKRKQVPMQIESHTKVGDLYFENQLYPKAKESYGKVLELADGKNERRYFHALKRTAWTNHLTRNFPIANTEYDQALQLAAKIGDNRSLLWIYQQKTDIAHQLGDSETEINLATEILKITNRLGWEEETIIALNNLGYVYKYSDTKDSAEVYFMQVVTALKSTPQGKAEAEVYKNLGILYQNEGRFVKADSALSRAGQKYRELGDTESESAIYDFRALVYYQNNDLHNAGVYNKKAIKLSKSKGHLKVLHTSYLTQSLIYQALYDYEEALESYKEHLRIRDSLMTMERNKQNDILNQQYFLERMEKELKLLWVKEELTQAELARIKAEDAAKAERINALKADSAAAATALRNKALEAREAYNKLLIAEEQNKLRQAKAEADHARQQQEIQALKVQQTQQKLQEEQLKAEVAEEKARSADLELERQASRVRNLIYVLIGLLALILLILFAYRQLRSKNRQIAAQQKEIAAEKDKSDKLLLNILPAQIAAELKEHGSTQPRAFSEITVVFTDFVGFTMISEQLTPQELVKTLDKIFLEFDLINERHGLQRIKTIGDAYMCACGLPEPDGENARKAVAAALDMRDYINEFNTTLPADAHKWSIRIGVNTGPVVAGVVGIKKFAYDIWGDAVNIASRMESSGEEGKVNISETTYAHIKNDFRTEHRGKVKAKNKGEIDMYFVER